MAPEDIYDVADLAESARFAVGLMREGKADFLMEGRLDTSVLLKALVDKEHGLGKGGIAYSKYVTKYIWERVESIAPVVVYAGEDDMLSLALGGLRVLRGEEKDKTYTKVKNPGY